jgi:hypothetical protein
LPAKELVDYIKNSIDQGVSVDAARQSALNAGWSAGEVEEATRAAQAAVPAAPSAVPAAPAASVTAGAAVGGGLAVSKILIIAVVVVAAAGGALYVVSGGGLGGLGGGASQATPEDAIRSYISAFSKWDADKLLELSTGDARDTITRNHEAILKAGEALSDPMFEYSMELSGMRETSRTDDEAKFDVELHATITILLEGMQPITREHTSEGELILNRVDGKWFVSGPASNAVFEVPDLSSLKSGVTGGAASPTPTP